VSEALQVPVRLSRAISEDPVSERLSEIIRQVGLNGKIPSERDLTKLLQVSRTAIRDRLQTLMSVGVLQRVPGSGTYVRQLSPVGLGFSISLGLSLSQMSLESLTSVRQALERQAAIEAATDADPVLVAYMGEALRTIKRAGDGVEVDEADFGFHVTLLRAARNPALSFFAEALADVVREAQHHGRAEMRRLPGDRDTMVDIHRVIYDAVLAGDPVRAAAAVDYHFARFQELTGHAVGRPVQPK